MGDKLICPICGEPTRVYMGNARKDKLCGKHADELKTGKIILCPDCNTYHNSDVECKCKKQIKFTKQDITCLICGKESNGKHFCLNCYNKYKNKIIFLQVKKCNETTLLEAEYESDLTCDDGHMVKSPYEKIIDNWFYFQKIQHAYENKLYISKTESITPDFYIPEYKNIQNIYVECWGYGKDNKKYQEIKEYKQKIYPKLCKEKKITVVYLSKKEIDDNSYKHKFEFLEPYKVNE